MVSERKFGGVVVFKEKVDHLIFDTIDYVNRMLSEINNDSIVSSYL